MKRNSQIDFLRATGIIGVVLIHSTLYRLGTPLMNAIWNYLHFVVPLLVYCSGYLVYKKYKDTVWSYKFAYTWFGKRVGRLILPYLLWNGAHFFIWKLFPGNFAGIGLDNDWIPILFLELMIATPIYLTLWKSRYRAVLILLVVLSAVWHPPWDYRIYMWLPWSTIYLLSFAAAEYGLKPKILGTVAAGAFVFFVLSNLLLTRLNVVLTLTRHKFPPDLFYLSYGVMMGSLLLLLEPYLRSRRISGIIMWLSRYSYELFFASYFVIDFIVTTLSHSGR